MKILSHKLEELPNLKYNTIITIECDNCHNPIYRQRKFVISHFKRARNNVFCNHKCQNEFRHRISLIKCICSNCNKEFERNKGNVNINNSKKTFCSLKCSGAFKTKNKKPKNLTNKIKKIKPNTKIKCNCKQCNKEIYRTPYSISTKKNKNGFIFCSRSCRMTYQNLNNPKKYSCRKSKAEIYLYNLIKQDFPNLIVTENNRTILKSKLEIDLFIPELKLAIELNGPVHYLPIYGEDRLKKCQNRDLIKQQEIHNLGLALIAIDISRLNSKKKTHQFLDEYYISHIKPIILNSGSMGVEPIISTL